MEYQRLSPLDYTVGWFSALPLELAAAALLLDESHPAPPSEFDDGQLYRFGRIGSHNVVMGCLPAGRTGLASAASAATRMSSTFGNLRVCLMVGIGGGVPSKKNDVRLGDVVVSQPRGGHGGVIQYDMGKVMPGGFYHTGPVNAPPEKLLQALAHLQVSHILEGNGIAAHLAIIERKETFQRPSAKSDVLFKPTYDHRAGERSCDRCDRSQIIRRNDRRHNGIEIHYGNIASGSCVMKDARVRDALSDQFKGVLCFEMEAAGLLNHWPCLVIRGISDYADSHKNDDWQGYAAGAAAAYARELLLSVKSSVQDQEPAAAIPLRVVGGALSGRSFQGSSVLPAHRIGTGRPGQGRQGHLEQNGFQRLSPKKGSFSVVHRAIETRGENGWTELHTAVQNADQNTVEELLGLAFTTTAKDNAGRTPLHIAAHHGHDSIARLLLEYGAATETKNNDNETPLYIAASKGFAYTAEVLIDGKAKLDTRCTKGNTPLYIAALKGFENVVRLLLERGAGTGVASDDGWTPLHVAAFCGHKAVVDLLLEKKSDMNATDKLDQRTPLFLAALDGHHQVVELLLREGANPNSVAKGGWTPMHAAAGSNRVETIRMLLEHGADIEGTNGDGETPLSTAAFFGQTKAVEYLLEMDADERAENYDGKTPRQVARKRGHKDIVRILKDYGG